MEQALRRLPLRRRNIFLLHRLDGLSYAEIAELYGISVRRVERHIAAAMLHLGCEFDGGIRRSWRRRWLDLWWSSPSGGLLAGPWRSHIGAMTAYSVLDLAPIVQGDAGQALRNSLDLARHAEQWGYTRFWLPEHHNMPNIASAATAVVIAHVAAGTSTIRVGAGGIMLPNHAPLVIAEQFGTLAALHPGRIDLGVGRAPGTDQITARALRRNLAGDIDSFPNDVAELLAYLAPSREGQRVRAIPGEGSNVPVWMLGSSLYGAQLAAAFGLPYAFASHFAPAALDEAIALYRQRFEPSHYLDKPYVIVSAGVFAADTDDEARRLFTSMQQAFLNLRRGEPTPAERAALDQALSSAVIGAPATVKARLAEIIARTSADELMLTGGATASQTFDHNARLRSFEIVAEAMRALG